MSPLWLSDYKGVPQKMTDPSAHGKLDKIINKLMTIESKIDLLYDTLATVIERNR